MISKNKQQADVENAGIAYANLLLSDEGQKIVKQAGFVPIHDYFRARWLNINTFAPYKFAVCLKKNLLNIF